MGAAFGTDQEFVVWGIDQTAYGPVDLPSLVSWIKDDRVTAETWIFVVKTGAWERAKEVAELQMFFHTQPREGPAASLSNPRGVDPRALRRIKILAELKDEDLERFAEFVEVEKVPQWALVVRQGDPGDSMYLILEGELRARIEVMGRETILTTLGPGDFFGDISVFDHGPRSADVVANVDSLVVRVTARTVDELARKAPELAIPFLRAISKTLTSRIRSATKRYGDSVKLSRTLG